MEEIICRQNASAKPATGKTFVLGVASIVFRLAIAQIAVNLLIGATGLGLLNILFYAYAVWVLVRFMQRTVAGCIYTLKSETLALQKMLGDSTVSLVEIPLRSIVSIRPIVYGERLHLDYRQVNYIDSRCAPGLRMRAAFALSLVFVGLARAVAGKKARRSSGFVVVYMEGGARRACAFRPNQALLDALEEACPEAYGTDERLMCKALESYWARSLRRAFPDLYPQVRALVSEAEKAWAKEEFARRKEMKLAKAAAKKNIPLEAYRAKIEKEEKRKAAKREKRRACFSSIAGKFAFLSPIREKIAALIGLIFDDEDFGEEETPAQQEETPRRRRTRQE